MLVSKENITELVPQRDPILMIDCLTKQDEQETETTFLIAEDNLFVRDNTLQEGGILENIAQTAAARAGYYYQQQNVPPPLGFIGAISKVKILKSPTVGETLRTVVRVKSEVFNITLIQGFTYLQNELIAECEMKIVIDDQGNAQSTDR